MDAILSSLDKKGLKSSGSSSRVAALLQKRKRALTQDPVKAALAVPKTAGKAKNASPASAKKGPTVRQTSPSDWRQQNSPSRLWSDLDAILTE